MAEIHIEPRRPIWPWIVGLVALVLIVWAVAAARTEDPDAGRQRERDVSQHSGPAGTARET